MDSEEEYDFPDLEKIKEDLHSLHPDQYMRFMMEVHFECPFKTDDMTEEIVNYWKNDHSMETEKFNKIIEIRKEEQNQEAKQKRQRDLTRINDMKSKTGLDPLQLFPKEIWMMLLDQLSPKDKRNFREIHEIFQNLTEDSVIGDILLPMILGFRVEHFWGELYRRILQNPDFRPLAHYTELRLVSKTMRNAVDLWFEDDLIAKLHSGKKNASPTVVVDIDLQDLDDVRKFARMRDHVSTSSSPSFQHHRFYTRSLYILSPRHSLRRPQDEDEVEELVHVDEYINEILDKIGDQIWYFSFEFNQPSYITLRNEVDFTERYSIFLDWLAKMPNLKWLTLSLNLSEFNSKFGSRIPDGQESITPTLSHLERLDMELKQPNRFVLPAYNQILTANPHIKILNLIGLKSVLKKKNGFVIFDDDPMKTPLANLEVLIMDGSTSSAPSDYDDRYFGNNIHDGDGDDQGDKFTDAIIFQSIVETNWPLRQIDLEHDKRSRPFIDVVFHWLATFKTLEKIRLSFEDIMICNRSSFLKLPNLTHFEFKVKKSFDILQDTEVNWRFIFSLQFLLYAKKLKSLIWNCSMEENGWKKIRDDTKEPHHLGDMLDLDWITLELLGLNETETCDIEDSNIWRVFRNLEKVELDLYVRKGPRKVEKRVSRKYLRHELDFLERSSECSSSNSHSSSECGEEEVEEDMCP